nr:hypothetical protein BaRGS_025137 [Batillaria attramentaria]
MGRDPFLDPYRDPVPFRDPFRDPLYDSLAPKKPVDCEIIIMNAQLRDYADLLERRLKNVNLLTEISYLLNLLADNRQLTVEELDKVIMYLKERKDKLLEAEGLPPSNGTTLTTAPAEPPPLDPIAQQQQQLQQFHEQQKQQQQQELQHKILSMMNGTTAPAGTFDGDNICDAGTEPAEAYLDDHTERSSCSGHTGLPRRRVTGSVTMLEQLPGHM